MKWSKFATVIWLAPEYFDKWRIFPRIFLSVYIYLLYDVVQWFMVLSDPNTQQAGLVSVLVGVGAAWFGLYINGTPTKHTNGMPTFENVSVTTTQTGSTSTISDTRN